MFQVQVQPLHLVLLEDLMSYGVWGPWSSTVGPNAPLNDSCAAVTQGSAVSAVGAWENAGFPRSKV